jgi:segregation and condensation protein A
MNKEKGDIKDRSLASFTIELDVYSGPYEGLLALILKEEVEIFEIPLRELVSLYRNANPPAPRGETPGALERDTDFVDSATSLILLKGRALAPYSTEAEGEDGVDTGPSPEDLEERLVTYLKIKRGAEALRERISRNSTYYPSAHALCPRPGRIRLNADRLAMAARRAFLRTAEPAIGHLGTVTVTVAELAALIRSSLVHGPVSYEDLVREMDRLSSAVAFAAALSLAAQGRLTLVQSEPFGPLTLEPPK